MLLVGTILGCVSALKATPSIRLFQIRRIEIISGAVGVATDQHYYRMYLSSDVTQPIKIEQLD